MRQSVCRNGAWAFPFRFWRSVSLLILGPIAVVFIYIHLTCCWFVMLRALLFWGLGHAWYWLGRINGWKRRRMMSSLRWMVAVVQSPSVHVIMRAVSWRRGYPVGRGRTSAMRLIQSLALLVISRRLLIHWTFIFPFPRSLGRRGWSPLITFASGSFSCCLGGCRSWSATSDTSC